MNWTIVIILTGLILLPFVVYVLSSCTMLGRINTLVAKSEQLSKLMYIMGVFFKLGQFNAAEMHAKQKEGGNDDEKEKQEEAK